ncbi:MAG: alkaline phosphatase family protein [Candidatus Baltobacteraceae bacterium]
MAANKIALATMVRMLRLFCAHIFVALLFLGGYAGASAATMRFDHIAIIMLENHSDLSIVGNPNAPRITQLALSNGYAAAFYGVTHPSLPNYIALTSGNNWYSNSDLSTQRFSNRNLVDQLEGSGISWKAYMQSLPSAGYTGDFYPADEQHALYVIRHDPFMLYSDVLSSPQRRARVVPFSEFPTDARSGNLPHFIWISPDVCHDMHGMSGPPCPYSDDPQLRRTGDQFVSDAVTMLLRSPTWTGRSVIFIMLDETDYNGDKRYGGWLNARGCCDTPVVPKGFPSYPQGGAYGGGLIPFIVISGVGKKHFVSNIAYNHYSVLRTIESAWRLGFLGMAADSNNVRSLDEFFVTRP